MTNLASMTIRNFRLDDLPALTELINEADQLDNAGYTTTLAALSHRLAEPCIKPTEDLSVAEVDGHLVGYVLVSQRPEETMQRIFVVGIVHPRWRRQGIGTALMRRAEQRARMFQTDKPLFLQMGARERVPGADELALAMGLRPVRCSFYMQCHDLQHLPEPVFPAGIRVRSFVVGQDEEAFVRADNDGFSDHWGFVPTRLEQVHHWLKMPGVRPDHWLLAVDPAGCIAGFCLLYFPQMDAHMLESNPPHIDDLAVVHAWRRRGLGRALLLTGMRRIRDLGFHSAALGVDAENPNQAVRLYESVGFVVAARSTEYRKLLTGTAEETR